MKWVSVYLIIIVAVNLSYQSESNNLHRGEHFVRNKRQNTPWKWRNNVQNNNARFTSVQTTTPKAPTQGQPNPCDPYVSKKPDFRKLQKRISVAKCLEYIWELKDRIDKEKHDEECTRWKAYLLGNRFVIGGRITKPGEFPHMGALGWRAVQGSWIFKCGSTLISHKFLITAAHCSSVTHDDTDVADIRPQIVRLGDKNIIDKFTNGRKQVDYRISRIIVHPQYSSPKMYFDIALVELADNVKFTNNIHPACLWNKFDTKRLGSKAVVTGWGGVNSADRKTSPELQAAEVDLIDQNRCDNLLRPVWSRLFRGLQPHQLCAGKLAGGVDACQGDSGGPLQVKFSLPNITQVTMSHLLGVTSFGVGCARANTPGVYTRVASFMDWIEDIVWGR